MAGHGGADAISAMPHFSLAAWPLFIQPIVSILYPLSSYSRTRTVQSSTQSDMATLQNSSVCVCPSNSDSPLSTTANILSILIFGYVLVLSSLYTFTIRWSSSGDLLNVRFQLAILHQRYESANTIHRTLPGREGP